MVKGSSRFLSISELIQLAPAILLLLGLFGGGLFLGLLQALGYNFQGGLTELTLDHFRTICTDPDFPQSLGLTFYIASGSTIIAATISVLLALALSTAPRNSKAATFFLQIPLTVPHLVVAIAVLFLLSPSGLIARGAVKMGVITTSSQFPLLINDQWGIGIMLTYVWKEIPFICFMVLAVLQHDGQELVEAGKTMGANRTQRFFYILLPLIWPNLAAACLIVFAYTFGAFEVPYLLGQTYPMVLPVWAYKSYADIDLLARPEGIGLGLIISAVVILLVLIIQLLIRLALKRRGEIYFA